METKPLLYGLIGFFIGGLLVSIAATTFDKPTTHDAHNERPHHRKSSQENEREASLKSTPTLPIF